MATFPTDYNNKVKGDPILSAEWNELVNQVDARLPKAGGQITGPLSIGDGRVPATGAQQTAHTLSVTGQSQFKGRLSIDGQLWIGSGDAEGIAGIGVENVREKLHVGGHILAHGLYTPCDEGMMKARTKLKGMLERLYILESISYQHRTNIQSEWGVPDSRHIGFAAQNVEAVFPDLVVSYAEGYKAVNYLGLVPVLAEAIKEVANANVQWDAQIQALTSDTQALAYSNAQIDTQMQALIADTKVLANTNVQRDTQINALAVETQAMVNTNAQRDMQIKVLTEKIMEMAKSNADGEKLIVRLQEDIKKLNERIEKNGSGGIHEIRLREMQMQLERIKEMLDNLDARVRYMEQKP